MARTQGKKKSAAIKNASVAALTIATSALAAHGQTTTYLMEWSGAPFGNSAAATGHITFNTGYPELTDSPPPAYGFGVPGSGEAAVEMEITVTGAVSGNGTFFIDSTHGDDFCCMTWASGDTSLDLSTEMVGQVLDNGQVWGTPSTDGAFPSGDVGFVALFGNGSPNSTGESFVIQTDFVFGDLIQLTSFRPAPPPCIADVTTQGAGSGDPGYGVPDGAVTAADLNYFVNAWVAGDVSIADVTTQGAGSGDPGYGVPDGAVTAADLNYFVNAWVAGCP